MTHNVSLVGCSGAPTPLSRMMTLLSPVPAVTIDGCTEHFPPPLLFTDIPDPASGDASAISGHINHPSCPVVGVKSKCSTATDFVVSLFLTLICSNLVNVFDLRRHAHT